MEPPTAMVNHQEVPVAVTILKVDLPNSLQEDQMVVAINLQDKPTQDITRSLLEVQVVVLIL